MKKKIFLPVFFSAVFFLFGSNTNACNYTFISLVNTPTDNGDGTYTVTVHITIGLMISWGGTTNFSLTPVGGSFTTISSFSPTTLTSNYNFCPLCNTTLTSCDSSFVNVTATADGVLNGPQTIITYSQASSFPAAGCSPPLACWGSGFPFVADDHQTVCDSTNLNYLEWDITITMNGLPAFITFQGCEDDIGPDIMSAGNPGCPESVLMSFPTSVLPQEKILINNICDNHSLSFNLPSPQSFSLNIFSADGKKVSEKKYSLGSGQHRIDLPTENLEAGIYFCRVTGENINKSIKFIIQ